MSANAFMYPLISFGVLIVLGCIYGYYGFAMLRKSMHLLNQGVLTTGIYQGKKRVEFVTTSGMRLTTGSQSRSRRATPSIGKKVRVLYDAQRPRIACVASYQELALSPAARICVASGLVGMGILGLLTFNVLIGLVGLVGILMVGLVPVFLYANHTASILQARSKPALDTQHDT